MINEIGEINLYRICFKACEGGYGKARNVAVILISIANMARHGVDKGKNDILLTDLHIYKINLYMCFKACEGGHGKVRNVIPISIVLYQLLIWQVMAYTRVEMIFCSQT